MKKWMVVSASCLAAVALVFSYGVYWAFFDMERLPKGDFLSESVSPDGNYTVRAYLSEGAGATSSYAVLGELVSNKDKNKSKNIYWNYREDKAIIEWIDSSTVKINGRTLSVPDEKYDFRNDE